MACIINSNINYSNEIYFKDFNFNFENESYYGYINDKFGSLLSFIYDYKQEPIHMQIRNSLKQTNINDITYYLVNQTNENLFQLDKYAGLIKYYSFNKLIRNYSLLIYAKYQNLITLTCLNILIQHKNIQEEKFIQSIYEFKLYQPFVNNYTIGYLNQTNKNYLILNQNILSMISIDQSGRLFIKNHTLLLINGNFYDFLIQNENLQIIRIKILILFEQKQTYECRLNRFNYSNDQQLIGFIEILNINQTKSICHYIRKTSFKLLNYNHLFLIHRQHGLLYYRNVNQTIDDDLLLLIQIDNSRCLIRIEREIAHITYAMIRKGSSLEIEMKEKYNIQKVKILFHDVMGAPGEMSLSII